MILKRLFIVHVLVISNCLYIWRGEFHHWHTEKLFFSVSYEGSDEGNVHLKINRTYTPTSRIFGSKNQVKVRVPTYMPNMLKKFIQPPNHGLSMFWCYYWVVKFWVWSRYITDLLNTMSYTLFYKTFILWNIQNPVN